MNAMSWRTRVRRRLVHDADRVLSALRLVDAREVAPPPPAAPAPAPVAPMPEPEPVAAPAATVPEEEGPVPVTAANVQALLDDMVRPALQADGGDIALVKVDGNDVYVRLVGACSSCPSATMTMRVGIERLLREELIDFGDLIEVGDYEI